MLVCVVGIQYCEVRVLIMLVLVNTTQKRTYALIKFVFECSVNIAVDLTLHSRLWWAGIASEVSSFIPCSYICAGNETVGG